MAPATGGTLRERLARLEQKLDDLKEGLERRDRAEQARFDRHQRWTIAIASLVATGLTALEHVLWPK